MVHTPLQPPQFVDNPKTAAHMAMVNDALADMNGRKNRGQAAYLIALMSLLTRWTAPRKLVDYARDLCPEDDPVGRTHLWKVRTAAVVYATSRDADAAIAKAEELEHPVYRQGGPT